MKETGEEWMGGGWEQKDSREDRLGGEDGRETETRM